MELYRRGGRFCTDCAAVALNRLTAGIIDDSGVPCEMSGDKDRIRILTNHIGETIKRV